MLLLLVSLAAQAGPSTAADSLETELEARQTARDLAGMDQVLSAADESWLSTPSGLRWQARAAQIKGDHEQAQALVERGLELDSDHVELILMQAEMVGAELAREGGMSALRQARQLRNEMRRAVELAPEHPGARLALIQYYLNAPRIAGGGTARAERQLEELKQIDPAAWLGIRGQQSWSDGDLEAAADYFERADDQDSGRDWLYLRALAMLQLERWESARADLLNFLDRNPHHGGAWYQLGRTSVASQTHLQEGLEAFERFLALNRWPGDPPAAAAWWRTGNLHELAGDRAAARIAYERALDEDPQYEDARQALSELDTDH